MLSGGLLPFRTVNSTTVGVSASQAIIGNSAAWSTACTQSHMIHDPGKPPPGSLLGALGGSEINRVRYRQAKETKCGGKDVRKSQ